jgi:hypothetical protein
MSTQNKDKTPDKTPLRPSDAAGQPSRFDRLSSAVAATVAKAWFFLACVLLVLLWAPSILIIGSVDTWQLIINTATTIITFLLVALLQNTQSRDNKAIHRKLNALVEGLADLMETHQDDDESLAGDIGELKAAVGLEHREGS